MNPFLELETPPGHRWSSSFMVMFLMMIVVMSFVMQMLMTILMIFGIFPKLIIISSSTLSSFPDHIFLQIPLLSPSCLSRVRTWGSIYFKIRKRVNVTFETVFMVKIFFSSIWDIFDVRKEKNWMLVSRNGKWCSIYCLCIIHLGRCMVKCVLVILDNDIPFAKQMIINY